MTTEQVHSTRSGGHIPALDGLRGIAILAVMALHFLTIENSRGPVEAIVYLAGTCGWAGVDLFFVLSGFLITTGLLRTRGQSGYYRNFFARRTLRIFPLYYLALFFWFIVFPAVADTEAARELSSRASWYWWVYLGNVDIARNGAIVWPTAGHFWSLAIEEQFYLVWPGIVAWLGPRHLLRACGLMVVGAVAFRVFCVWAGWGLSFYVLTPSRMDALALGAAVALLWQNGAHRAALVTWAPRVAALTAVTFVLLRKMAHDSGPHDPVMWTAGYTVVGLLSASVLVMTLAAPADSILNRSLTRAPLRALGKYSYALYVVHHPIQAALRQTTWFSPEGLAEIGSQLMAQVAFAVVAGTLSLALAIASWHLFEKHFLKLKDRFASVHAVPSAVSAPI